MGLSLSGIIDAGKDFFTDDDGIDWGKVLKTTGAAAGVYGILNPNDSSGLANFFGTGGRQQPVGYTGGIPNYTATRELAPDAFVQTYAAPTGETVARRPGSVGRRYFTDTTFTPSTDEPYMGVTAEQIAAQNQTAQADYDLFMDIVRNVSPEYLSGGEATTLVDSAATTNQLVFPSEVGVSSLGGTHKEGVDAAIKMMEARRAKAAAESTAAQQVEQDQFNNFLATLPSTLTVDDVPTIANSGYSSDRVIKALKITPEQYQELVDAYTGRGFASGGLASLAPKGMYLGGSTDGMADQIPATIDNTQPAALSDGEFVIPADVVSHLGNGNSDSGAQNLYSMMERVRKDRTGNPNQGRKIDPNKYLA